jgi:hypothetical protein
MCFALSPRTIHFLLAHSAAKGVCNPCYGGVVTTAYFTGAVNLTVDGSKAKGLSLSHSIDIHTNALDLYRIPGTSPRSLTRISETHNNQLRQMDSI